MIGEATMAWEVPVRLESEAARLRRGDPAAFEALLERYQNRLYRYLLRMVREPATAEDLFQQTWLRVAEKIRSYNPQRSFEAWLFSVTRNLAIDHLRRYKPESLDEPTATGETRLEQLPGQGPTALEGVIVRERSSRMAEALGELPVIYREVLSLRFEDEMKLEEIAEVLGTPLSTVKTRLRRGLEQMRVRLETRGAASDWKV